LRVKGRGGGLFGRVCGRIVEKAGPGRVLARPYINEVLYSGIAREEIHKVC
jgi:hypothetical protein